MHDLLDEYCDEEDELDYSLINVSLNSRPLKEITEIINDNKEQENISDLFLKTNLSSQLDKTKEYNLKYIPAEILLSITFVYFDDADIRSLRNIGDEDINSSTKECSIGMKILVTEGWLNKSKVFVIKPEGYVKDCKDISNNPDSKYSLFGPSFDTDSFLDYDRFLDYSFGDYYYEDDPCYELCTSCYDPHVSCTLSCCDDTPVYNDTRYGGIISGRMIMGGGNTAYEYKMGIDMWINVYREEDRYNKKPKGCILDNKYLVCVGGDSGRKVSIMGFSLFESSDIFDLPSSITSEMNDMNSSFSFLKKYQCSTRFPLQYITDHTITGISRNSLAVVGGSQGSHLFGYEYRPQVLNQVYLGTLDENENDIKWEMVERMKKARRLHVSFVISNYLFVAGGIDKYGKTLSSSERYDIENIRWEVPPFLFLILCHKHLQYLVLTNHLQS